VPAGAFFGRQIGVGLDQMADHLAAGGVGNAEVAIQEEIAQAPALEFGIAWCLTWENLLTTAC
jgi:hypothetical protein